MSEYGVIFDMDGVLVDSYRAHYKSWQRVADEYDLTISEAAFVPTFGRTSREAVVQLWPERGFSKRQVTAIDLRKEVFFRKILAADFPVMAGALDLIDRLYEAGFRLAVGSSGPPENVSQVLDLLGQRTKFQAVITGKDVTQGKPHPQVFLTAAEQLGLSPKRCVVIEDAPLGIEAANAAGATSVALVHPYHNPAAFAHSDHRVNSLKELTPQKIQAWVRG